MSRLETLQSFIDALREARSLDELRGLMERCVLETGFDWYAIVHHVDLRFIGRHSNGVSRGQFALLTNYPPEWTSRYLDAGTMTRDAVLAAAQVTSAAFTWDEIPRLIRLTPAQRRLAGWARERGIGNGVTVPANVPGEMFGSCHFAIRAGKSLPADCLAVMQPIGVFAFEAARRLAPKFRAGWSGEPVRLTDRQVECLALVAQGKTDWEIARILGISEETVKRHLRDVRQRYDVPKRIQAIIRALFDGQLPLTEMLT